MFADPNYSGKFQNEFEGIENATKGPQLTAEEQEERVAEALAPFAKEFVEALAPFVKGLVEALKKAAEILAPCLKAVAVAYEHMEDACPNRRVAHLARYGKKERTRKKNRKRIIKYYYFGR